MGYPVHIMDDMPPLVAGIPSKAIVFGNFFEGYQIVDRQGIYVLRDPYSISLMWSFMPPAASAEM